MATLTLQVETATKGKHEDIPNAMTMAAIREIESGKDAGVVNMNSLSDFVASMD